MFDTDADGYINGEDIRKTMRQLGEELSEADVKDMMFEADLDKDGRINFAGKLACRFRDYVLLTFGRKSPRLSEMEPKWFVFETP